MQKMQKGAGLPPPPPQATGANALVIQNQQHNPENNQQQHAVNQVGNPGNPNGNQAGPSTKDQYQEHHAAYCVFTTEPMDKQSQRRRAMEVNDVAPAVPKYMPWCHQEISWSQEDHLKVMPNPGGYALVLDPTLIGPGLDVKFSLVLIDNGSNINILYRDAMIKLGVTDNMLEPSRTTFHGIMPGLSCVPISKIRVDVLFETRENCRTENIEFEVVDLESQYHALLGRPALAKFMASTHIAYLKMKMPGPNGPITISGNFSAPWSVAVQAHH